VNGYALGESIAGAEPAPLYGYFVGLALIQSAIALAVMGMMPMLTARKPMASRLMGGLVLGVGVGVLGVQLISAA
jgi:urease accessory protein